MPALAPTTPQGIEQANKAAARCRVKIAKIHVAKKQLDMDEESYRAMLKRVTGKISLKECHEPQLDRMILELTKKGFKAIARTASKKSTQVLATDAEISKARAVWLTLHEMGEVRDASEAAFAAYAKRICKVDSIRWVKDYNRLIETLKKWAVRVWPKHAAPLIAQLVASGRLPAGTTFQSLADGALYKRSGDTYDAQLAAWERLLKDCGK